MSEKIIIFAATNDRTMKKILLMTLVVMIVTACKQDIQEDKYNITSKFRATYNIYESFENNDDGSITYKASSWGGLVGIIKERNLEWASVEIDSVEVPVAESMQDIADYYNDADVLDTMELERMIEANGWVSDCDTEWGVCHNDTEKVVINDEGEAVVMSI